MELYVNWYEIICELYEIRVDIEIFIRKNLKNVSNLAEGLSNCEVITRSILMVLFEKGTLSKYE